MTSVNVIGAGLAGCEAALFLANRGVPVNLFEMKPIMKSPAHRSDFFAELVCSNSLKADRLSTSAGLLHAEMRMLGSVVMEAADQTKVPAGGSLSVDRDKFSKFITDKINSNPLITVIPGEVTKLPQEPLIIASGPLTSDSLSKEIISLTGIEHLSFFDAAAPIISFDSINTDITFFASRYGKGDADYINCPFTKDEYLDFYDALINAETATLKDFEINVFEGCMPIEVMAKRGIDTLRFGPLKPVGLTNPHDNSRPYAVAQLRRENVEGTLYNIVGFQTNLTFGAQKEVFSKIPGLKNAEFMRYGVMHRNTFINSPSLLNFDFSLRNNQNIYFAGQISGVEGYCESALSGILAAFHLYSKLTLKTPEEFPSTTFCGALPKYISSSSGDSFQPMNANMGILPQLEVKIKNKQERYEVISNRGLEDLKNFLSERQ